MLANLFPRCYYVTNSIINNSNNAIEYWNGFLSENWDNPKFNWPTKNDSFPNYFIKDEKILDIGFGTATLLRAFLAKGFTNLWGYEQSDFALRQIEKLNIKAVKGCLPKLDLNDNSFDGVIASEVLEHILRRKLFLKEIRRVMKPNGLAIITVPNNTMGPEEIPEHTYKYNIDSLKRLLARYFVVKELYSIKDSNHQDETIVAIVTK